MHVPGIGKDTEIEIWKKNILSWEEFLEKKESMKIRSKDIIDQHISKSLKAYDEKKFRFFLKNFPENFHWRAYPDLKEKCCFLDIETTGLDKQNDDITLIGLYDGKDSRIFINGKNMQDFGKEIDKYDMIVTFNGKCFDIPFIQSKFPDANLDKFHIDLRFAMRNIGYAGGLKRIEKEVGIERGDGLKDIDGLEAVRLWYRYKRGDKKALDTLVEYNKADIENLKTLMEIAFKKLKEKEFLCFLA